MNMDAKGNEVQSSTCSFDLAYALSVEHCSTADEANLLLQDGWVLVVAGIDANGFPLFILADPSTDWPGPQAASNGSNRAQS